jgi:putative ABC transport system substrate-binding protein
MLVDPTSPESVNQASDVVDAARALGQQLAVLHAGTANEIDLAFASLAQRRADALLISGSSTFLSRRDQLITSVTRHKVPTMYSHREFTMAGGLISYGANLLDSYRQAGFYVGRVLRGDKPADLPVVQPTRFELVLNLKTTKALGLELSPSLLALADEVIE